VSVFELFRRVKNYILLGFCVNFTIFA